MPRIRTIKPEFWDSPGMRGCNPWARLLFIALWQWADDHGRGTANVRELAAFAFPDEQDPTVPTAKELPSLLSEIRGRFGVVFYEVDGRRYYYLPTFSAHQRTERKAKSRYPAPEEGVEYDPDPADQGRRLRDVTDVGISVESEGSSDAVEGSSDAVEGSSGPGSWKLEQGNRGTGEETHSLAPLAAIDPPDPDPLERFQEFYDAYPRHVGRRAAEKAWRAAIKRKVHPQHMIDAARRYSERTADTDPSYIKHPSTWLNAGSYDDEPDRRPTPRCKPSVKDERVANILSMIDPSGPIPESPWGRPLAQHQRRVAVE